MAVIAALNVYPLKAAGGIDLAQAELLPTGIRFDRMFMVVTEAGAFVTQRELPALAVVRTKILPDGLCLEHDGSQLKLPLDARAGKIVETAVHGASCQGFDQGEEAAAWITNAVGKYGGASLRLLAFDHTAPRRVDPFFAPEETHAGFADSFPYLVTSTASLAQLNQMLVMGGEETVPMNRFRPNIVIDGLDPFEEDDISILRFPESNAAVRLVKPCARCVVTTVDQETGARGKEPLKSLGRFRVGTDRRGERGIMFGQKAILEQGSGALLSNGESVVVELKK
ncbi:MAG: MOSC N-terminal beta barrel domain-containing protein [Oligoflexia bacterium]|nr:MOSC N-terminal beta barrel domain-containing protein [Oligoflexia bacterium]